MSNEIIKHRIIDDDEGDFPDEYQVLGEDPVTLETRFPSVLVIDNLPVIPAEKFDKLKLVLSRLYAPQTVVQMDIPRDDSGATVGYAFIEFTSPSVAQEALNRTNGYKLDRSHVFRVNFYDDFSLYEDLPDVFVPEELPPFKPKENLWWWLAESDNETRARDQYVIKLGDSTEVYWNDGRKRSEAILKKKNMTETYVQWSPYGTYLATFHQEGVILWGGPNWDKVVRFRHPGVTLLDFSPKENYLVTISDRFRKDDNPQDPQYIIVWDVRSGRKLRGFLANPTPGGAAKGEASAPAPAPAWPVFKWSHDERFLARHGEDAISVYEAPSMGMLQNKSLKLPGVKANFEWSPSDNIIACWTPELGGKPAGVQIIDLPTRNVRRSHNLYKVQDCHLHWSTNGDYLCIKVDRTATKKTTQTSFELCRMREKSVAIEPLQMTENVVAFAWEPKGHRFAVVHGTSQSRLDVSFYTMEGKKHSFLKKLEKRTVNNIFWSPRGGSVILAGIGSNLGGYLEFFNVDDMESMRTDSHHMLTNVDWDPTGRYVVTSTSYWRHQLDSGFSLWTFQGKQLWHVTRDKFYMFAWRPRPPTLLSAEKLKEIERKLRDYSAKYKKEDLKKRRAIFDARKKKRQAQVDAFRGLREQRLAEKEKDRQQYVKLMGYDPDDASYYEEREDEVEELLDDTTEVIASDDF